MPAAEPNPGAPRSATWRLLSPQGSEKGAIALLEVAGDVDGACARLGIASPQIGRFAFRQWSGVDEVVVARVRADLCLICPHAGGAVLTRIRNALERARIVQHECTDPRAAYPEARSLVEARMLDALARAKSSLAIDLLAAQPSRWAKVERAELGVMSDDDSRILRRLIDPALIVAVGPPNIGKSSLLNELAGRTVSLVADEPGTTRDHVGVDLDLGGLAVRYLDLPGLDDKPSKNSTQAGATVLDDAQRLAREVIPRADLVLLCADPTTQFVRFPAGTEATTYVRAVLRADLWDQRAAPASGQNSDVVTSVKKNIGIAELVATIRDRLVPRRLIDNPLAWRFWT